MKKIAYASISPNDLMLVCLKAIQSNGLSSVIGRKQPSDFVNITQIIVDSNNIKDNHFKNGVDINLRITEALSLAYLALYYQHHTKRNIKYMVNVDIDDNFKNESQRELYLSDGVLGEVDATTGEPGRYFPLQQVMAQNVIGKNINSRIEDIIIQEINKKVARRDTYNKVSGLAVSVIPGHGSSLQLDEILQKCDIEKFLPTFLLLYSDNFETCQIIHLDKGLATKGEEITRMRRQSLIIRGSLPDKSPRKLI